MVSEFQIRFSSKVEQEPYGNNTAVRALPFAMERELSGASEPTLERMMNQNQNPNEKPGQQQQGGTDRSPASSSRADSRNPASSSKVVSRVADSTTANVLKSEIESPAARRGFHFCGDRCWPSKPSSNKLEGWARHCRYFISTAIRRTIPFSISSILKRSRRAPRFMIGPFALIVIEISFRSC